LIDAAEDGRKIVLRGEGPQPIGPSKSRPRVR
jgi:hypothetical protein